jgi:hypothetical protein
MVMGRKALVMAGIVVVVAAGAACSGSSASSTAAKQPTTGVDQVLTLTPGQLLAATGGATPVAFAAPERQDQLRPGRCRRLHPQQGFLRD